MSDPFKEHFRPHASFWYLCQVARMYDDKWTKIEKSFLSCNIELNQEIRSRAMRFCVRAVLVVGWFYESEVEWQGLERIRKFKWGPTLPNSQILHPNQRVKPTFKSKWVGETYYLPNPFSLACSEGCPSTIYYWDFLLKWWWWGNRLSVSILGLKNVWEN